MTEKIPTYISLASSSISGMIHILLGYPFDTLKTLRQSSQDNTKYMKNLNTLSLFRGIKYPLIQNTLTNSTIFGLNNFFMNRIENKYISNLYTACVCTLILTPFDKLKVMSQYNIKYKFNCSFIKRSYKQLPIVAASEIPSTFIYFTTYQTAKEYNVPIFLSGSLAGVASWLFTYPLDTIKTRMLNESCKTISEAYQKKNLCRGLGICIFRSFFVNGVNFYSYEKINQLLIKHYR